FYFRVVVKTGSPHFLNIANFKRPKFGEAYILTSIIMVLHNRKKFDSISWKEKDDMTFPNRKSMVEDLIEKRFY
ncbi:MAG: hypothetical protein WCP85_31440, partial [Mariniphaga sp.]